MESPTVMTLIGLLPLAAVVMRDIKMNIAEVVQWTRSRFGRDGGQM
jgi:hypothetical protein